MTKQLSAVRRASQAVRKRGKHSETSPDFYSLAEEAARLDLSRTTLWRMRKRGKVPCWVLGGCIRFFRAWVKSLHSEPKSS
jgi:hypothetical protein